MTNLLSLTQATDLAAEQGLELATYSTRDEAVDREITAALGENADDYDLDALSDELIASHVPTDGNGVQTGEVEFYLAVDSADFWAAVERHAL